MLDRSDTPLLIYGAYGYSGKLVTEELISRNVKPVIGGRNEMKLKEMAEELNLDYLVFDLIDTEVAAKNLMDIHSVLNCAGPFSKTAVNMMEACLKSKTNYLDITGEIPVLEAARGYDLEAKEMGIIILPAVGFDVIPTDCLASKLKNQKPGAVDLKLGFFNKKGSISRGTLITTLEMVTGRGKIRRDGKIVDSPIGAENIRVNKKGFGFYGISIPWGDVSTAWYSTGIPDITVFLGLPRAIYRIRGLLIPLFKLLAGGPVNKFLSSLAGKYVTGPDENKRKSTETYVWGEVTDINGEKLIEAYRFMEGYDLTQKGAALALLKVYNEKIEPGTHTPSSAFGYAFMDSFVIKKIV